MLAGLILAGGEGRRFGGPKAWARLPDGRSFLEACSASLVGAGASPVLATLPPESGDPVIVGVQPLVLPEAGLDMFASLKVGLTRLIQTEDWDCVALLPVDHPLAILGHAFFVQGFSCQTARRSGRPSEGTKQNDAAL